MAQQLRAVKRRIVSVKSTQKITRAMELIASSRIIKAQRRVEAARPYAEKMRELMASVAKNAASIDHPLLRQRDEVAGGGAPGAKPVGYIVIRATERDLAEASSNKLFVSGKKGISYFRFRGYDIAESWQGYSDQPRIEHARAVAAAAVEAFVNN